MPASRIHAGRSLTVCRRRRLAPHAGIRVDKLRAGCEVGGTAVYQRRPGLGFGAQGEEAPLRQPPPLDQPGRGSPIDPHSQATVIADPLPVADAHGHGHAGTHPISVDPIVDRGGTGRCHQPLDGMHQVMLLGDERQVGVEVTPHKAGMAVGDLLGPILVEFLGSSGVDPPAGVPAGPIPTLVITHAVVHDLGMDLEEFEVEQRRVVLASFHLRFGGVEQAGPIQHLVSFAKERALVGGPQVGKQFRVALHLVKRHGGQRLRGVVVKLVPRGHAGVDVKVAGRGAVATMRFGGHPLGESQGSVALDSVALHARAWVEPGLGAAPVGFENHRLRVPGGSIGVDVDVVLVYRPGIAEPGGGGSESGQVGLGPIPGIGREMVWELHVVAIPLPVVEDDGEVVDALILQVEEVLGVTGVGASHMPPEIEHDQGREPISIGRWRMRDVGEHLVEIARDGDAAHLLEAVPLSRGGRGILRNVLRRPRGMRLSPIKEAESKQLFGGQVVDHAMKIGHRDSAAERRAPGVAERQGRNLPRVRPGVYHQGLAVKAKPPLHLDGIPGLRIDPGHLEPVGAHVHQPRLTPFQTTVRLILAGECAATAGGPDGLFVTELHLEIVERSGCRTVGPHDPSVCSLVHERMPIGYAFDPGLMGHCVARQHTSAGVIDEPPQAGLCRQLVGRRDQVGHAWLRLVGFSYPAHNPGLTEKGRI